jgi:chemotaxis protein MotB
MAQKKHGHHGGAWKVAYADFVTAMMALFMVLWISTQETEILIATSQYFQNPFRAPVHSTSGVLPFNSQKLSPAHGRKPGPQEAEKKNQIPLTFLNSVAADFYRLLHLQEDLEDKPIDIQVTADGLRITVFNRPRRPLFLADAVEFTEWGSFVMQNLAWLIERHRFRVTIDGHTRDNRAMGRVYTGWELSADRANAARRSLVFFAAAPDQVDRVTGYADTRPLPDQPGDAESNDRITLSLTLSVRGAFKDRKLVEHPVAAESEGTPL